MPTKMGPRPLDLPTAEIVRRYKAGATGKQLADDYGVSLNTVLRRLRDEGVELRPPGSPAGAGSNRHDWLDTADVVKLWDEGWYTQDIAQHFGIGRSTVYERLREARGNRSIQDEAIHDLYVKEGFGVRPVAQRLGLSDEAVRERLAHMGVERHSGGGPWVATVAGKDSLSAIQRAVKARRTRPLPNPLDVPWGRTAYKQRDVLDILRAAPAPQPIARIIEVARDLPRKWRDLSYFNMYGTLKLLHGRGLVDGIQTVSKERVRGRKVILWLPVSEEMGHAVDAEDASRLREIQALIEEQQRDGDYVSEAAALSLDKQIGEDGWTLLDTLGDYDEAIGA